MHKQILAGQDERFADAVCFKAVLFCSVAISQIVLSSFLNRFGNFFCLRGLEETAKTNQTREVNEPSEIMVEYSVDRGWIEE